MDIDEADMPEKCGSCDNCLDMISLGGSGTRKMRCEVQLEWGRRKQSHASSSTRGERAEERAGSDCGGGAG